MGTGSSLAIEKASTDGWPRSRQDRRRVGGQGVAAHRGPGHLVVLHLVHRRLDPDHDPAPVQRLHQRRVQRVVGADHVGPEVVDPAQQRRPLGRAPGRAHHRGVLVQADPAQLQAAGRSAAPGRRPSCAGRARRSTCGSARALKRSSSASTSSRYISPRPRSHSRGRAMVKWPTISLRAPGPMAWVGRTTRGPRRSCPPGRAGSGRSCCAPACAPRPGRGIRRSPGGAAPGRGRCPGCRRAAPTPRGGCRRSSTTCRCRGR